MNDVRIEITQAEGGPWAYRVDVGKASVYGYEHSYQNADEKAREAALRMGADVR